MQYRKFGSLDWQVSALGFGCMRLPTADGNRLSEKINEQEAIEMIRYAFDQGVNYADSAYLYHMGASEVLLGKALKDGYRDRVRIATKSPVARFTETAEFDKVLNEQLTRLQTEQIDFYLLHGLSRRSWEIVERLGLLRRAEQALQDGKIGHLGFSFHDNFAAFEQIVNAYDKWTFCQIQYNYMDTENQAGTKGLRLAAEKGLAVVIMEPMLGGRLANPPADVRELLNSAGAKHTPANLALQWLWNQPEVSVVLSGMSEMEQVQENLRSASTSGVGSLSQDELELVERVAQRYRERATIPCTACSYCMPCPNGVDIPRNFKIYNDGIMHDDIATAKVFYTFFMQEVNRASACIQCEMCEEKCPQKITISEWMPKLHETLGASVPA